MIKPKLVGYFMKEGWTAECAFYLFKCKKHGHVVNYRQGLKKELRCPVCEKEHLKHG